MFEQLDDVCDGVPQPLDRSLCLCPQQHFEFGEGAFNGIVVWAVRRQIAERAACDPDGLPNAVSLVGWQVVHDDNVTWRERRHKNLFDIGPEGHAVMAPSKTMGAVMPESLSAPVKVVVFQ